MKNGTNGVHKPKRKKKANGTNGVHTSAKRKTPKRRRPAAKRKRR